MKIRIKGDSIRFRLTKTEVEALCSHGEFREETRLLSNSFTYAVVRSSDPGMRASLRDNTMTLHVNEDWLEGWDRGETVGFEDYEQVGRDTRLHLLLEKDFVCLDQREEDQSDNYPNPKLEKKNLV